MNLLFVILGGLSALLGLFTLIAALRGRPGESRKSTAQLIGGMMLLAFGLVLAGFAIAFATTEPYDFNSPAPGAN
jgi:ABC-type Na+ efflux pump permease subunit